MVFKPRFTWELVDDNVADDELTFGNVRRGVNCNPDCLPIES